MSGDGKRGDGHRPPATAPIFDSTKSAARCSAAIRGRSVENRKLYEHPRTAAAGVTAVGATPAGVARMKKMIKASKTIRANKRKPKLKAKHRRQRARATA
jgi:hypothetical protein